MTHSFFHERESGLHCLHPLTKLTLGFTLILITFLARWTLAPIALFLLVVLPLAVWGHIGRELLRATLVVVMPFAFSLGLVQGLFFPGAQTILVQFGPLAIKREGLLFAFTAASRILVIASTILLLLYSTHPADLALALEQRGAPPSLAYIAVTAIQLLPEMQARAGVIVDAQRARGLETEGSLPVRLRAFLPLIGPLIYGALENVQERALALEARAFRASRHKTSWRELHDSKAQHLLRTLLILASIVALVLGIVY